MFWYSGGPSVLKLHTYYRHNGGGDAWCRGIVWILNPRELLQGRKNRGGRGNNRPPIFLQVSYLLNLIPLMGGGRCPRVFWKRNKTNDKLWKKKSSNRQKQFSHGSGEALSSSLQSLISPSLVDDVEKRQEKWPNFWNLTLKELLRDGWCLKFCTYKMERNFSWSKIGKFEDTKKLSVF